MGCCSKQLHYSESPVLKSLLNRIRKIRILGSFQLEPKILITDKSFNTNLCTYMLFHIFPYSCLNHKNLRLLIFCLFNLFKFYRKTHILPQYQLNLWINSNLVFTKNINKLTRVCTKYFFFDSLPHPHLRKTLFMRAMSSES